MRIIDSLAKLSPYPFEAKVFARKKNFSMDPRTHYPLPISTSF
jgi:hypothetical protein